MPLELECELVESARSGGADLDSVILAVWPEAYRIALSMLRDHGLAEDSAQEACVSIARSLPALKNNAVFAAWSYRIIVNHAIKAARRWPAAESLGVLADQRPRIDPGDALDLYDALATLPVAQRGAVLLHYYAGLNSGEIAEATGLPSSTIRFHLMLARKALREALSRADARAPQVAKEELSNAR
jgi:RNA polymerase sigma-70 factor (ECF subfamily)